MSERKALWSLAELHWRRHWASLLFMLGFTMYISFLIGGILGDTLGDIPDSPREATVLDIAIDWMYLMMFPVFGLCASSSSFRIAREDTFTKKLAFYRTLPIPLEAIVRARLFRIVLLIPLFGVLSLLMQYGITASIREHVTLGQWITFGLTWICYGLAVGAVLLWFELGTSGKRFLAAYWCYIALCGIAAGCLSLLGTPLVNRMLAQIVAGSSGQYIWLLSAALAAALAFAFGYRLALNRMRRRAYYF